jgi:hypothetical protein
MSFLSDIASAFAGIPGVEAVALAGSAVCQKADSLSDYDLYVYWQTPVPLDARKKIIASRASEYQLDNTYWELENEWIEPEGPPFNVMYRSCQEAEEEVPPASCTACGFSWIHDCVLFQPEAGKESGGPQ